MQFLELPVEVVDSYILPHLDWNDLLGLRLTCKRFKLIVDGYLNVNKDLVPEIQIREDEEEERSLHHFLTLSLTTTRIYIDNRVSGNLFYERTMNTKQGSEFYKRFASIIKHIRVAKLSRHSCGEERRFFNSFPELESVEAVQMLQNHPDPDESTGTMGFPASFERTLKTLRMGHDPEEDNVDYGAVYFFIAAHATHLENVMLPLNFRTREAFTVPIIHLSNWLEEKMKRGITSPTTIDFGAFHGEPEMEDFEDAFLASTYFLNFCQNVGGSEKTVRLKNVHSTWFRAHEHPASQLNPTQARNIISLINIQPWIFQLDLSQMECLKITSSESSPGFDWYRRRPLWPALKTLEINVNSLHATIHGITSGIYQLRYSKTTHTDELMRFLFHRITHPNLSTLHINFQVPYNLDINMIASACPNIKVLSLTNWQGSSFDSTQFPGLDEIIINDVKKLIIKTT